MLSPAVSVSRSVLLVAYHFPPLAGSSGIQRTLRLVQHLPALGWEPLVLTASPRAYERTSADLLDEVPADAVVQRAFALDTARHLSLRGRYVGAMARPDRWVTWRFDAVRQGMAMIRRFRPNVIWSTYPIATAHMIGAELHRRTGLPWIADFRDPMAQEGYPADPDVWAHFARIERHAVAHAARCTFTSPGAAADYARRYPDRAQRLVVVENGYDESSFEGTDTSSDAGQTPLCPGTLTLLHSGIVYPSERDPTALMAALQRLAESGRIEPGRVMIRFRAAVAEDLLNSLATRYRVREFIEVLPAVPYRQALGEMLRADGLLVMQAANCNAQIPAKVYEYLRAGRPTLGLADPRGDTAAVLRRAGLTHIAALEDVDAIANAMVQFLDDVRAGRAPRADPSAVRGASRQARSAEFAELLDAVAAEAQ